MVKAMEWLLAGLSISTESRRSRRSDNVAPRNRAKNFHTYQDIDVSS